MITTGLLLLLLLLCYFIQYFEVSGHLLQDICITFFYMAMGVFDGDEEILLSVLGIILLFTGVILNSKDAPNLKRLKKYRILRLIGFLPFVGNLCYSTYSAICGFDFFGTLHGWEAFLWSAIFYLLFCWPLYIMGLFMIIKNTLNIKRSNVNIST